MPEQRVEYSEFKGYPMIVLPMGFDNEGEERKSFQFGLGKARAILKHIEAIREFVNNNTK